MARASAAAALDAAAASVGFFYLRVPGAAEAGCRLLERCREFHALSSEAKESVAAHRNRLYRGYNATWASGGGSCAAEQDDPPDPKEVFMVGSEGDSSPMHGPNQWPRPDLLPSGWRSDLERDRAILLEAARTLSQALAAALGEPPDAFDDALRDPTSVLILLRYDPARLVRGSSTGCGAHTDCGFLSLLVQEPGCSPLQVQQGAADSGTADTAKAHDVDDAAWIDAPPKDGHLLVNLGDMLHRWTNGRYRSTIHRLILKPDDPPRHSCAFFANPTFTCTVRPFETCCHPTPDMPHAKYGPITAGDYISRRLGLMYEAAP